MKRPPLKLAQFFAFVMGGALLAIGVVFLAFLASSQREVLARSERQRQAAARRIEAQVKASLHEASRIVDGIATSAVHGAVDTTDPGAVEELLYAAVLNAPHVAAVSFTHAVSQGFSDHGETLVAPEARWEVSVFRSRPSPDSPLLTRAVRREGDRFVSHRRDRPPEGTFTSGPIVLEGDAADPTAAQTFGPPASKSRYGQPVWSDLHYSDLERGAAGADRRVVLSVQQTIEESTKHFAGVLRVELFRETIDDVTRLKVGDDDAADPHRVFLCDASGWLVTQLAPSDALTLHDGDLRVPAAGAPPAIAAALALPALAHMDVGHPDANATVEVAGEAMLVSFHEIAESQAWIIGIVVPEAYYTRDVTALRQRFLGAFVAFALVFVCVGTFLVARVRRAFGSIGRATAQMRAFDFAPAPVESSFRDITEVMEGLERAKTAMRALAKYVPVGLVRDLYAANREPTLGGDFRELTILFTDIRGFTSVAEGIPAEVLAPALGRYLEAMIAAVHATGGTIDKLIGDGIMAFWNAPANVENHASHACAAVLACIKSTEALFVTEAWAGLPPFFTRFGVHTDTVLVGHFGAPDRLSYTLMGDGVNLASRLEGLGKQYDVATLVSEAVVERVSGDFVFRRIDRVAVKGKSKGVSVYELLGPSGFGGPKLVAARAYERALEAYFAHNFGAARSILAPHLADGPSAVLDARCAQYQSEPPAADWSGIYVATSK